MVGNEENFQTNEEQYSGLILRCRDTKLRQSPKLALKTPTSLYSMIKLQPTLYFRYESLNHERAGIWTKARLSLKSLEKGHCIALITEESD